MGTKKSYDDQLTTERRLVAAIRDKMEALSSNLTPSAKKQSAKSCSRGYDTRSKIARRKLKEYRAKALKNEINLLLRAQGLKPHQHNPDIPKASREENLAIRFDFDGMMHRPATTDLSDAYSRYKQENIEQNNQLENISSPNYPLNDYDLNNSPVWQQISELENIPKLRRRITYQLFKNKIPPSIVPNLNYFDIMDLTIDACKETKTRPFEGSRSKNVKMFAHCYGAEFTDIMLKLRYKPDYIQKTLNLMKQGKLGNEIDAHHGTNVTNFREHPQGLKHINTFGNMRFTFIHPHHRCLHFDKGFDLNKDIVFFGGFDPAFQIRRNPEKERQYLISKGKIKSNANSR